MQRIRDKLITSFLTTIIVLVIVSGFFVAANFIVIKKYENIMDNMVSEYELIGKTQDVTDSFNNIIKYIRDQDRMDKFISNKLELQNLLIKLDSSIDDERSFSLYLGLRNTIESLISDSEKGINAILEGRYNEMNIYYEEINEKNEFVKESTSFLLLSQLEYLQGIQVDIVRIRKLIELSALGLFILVVLFTILYSIRFSDKLVYPLEKISIAAKNIEDGNLNTPIDKSLLHNDDEVGLLANSFSTMVSSLKNNIEKLQEYNVEIKSSRNKLRSERNKLKQYLDVAGIFVITFDFDGKLLMINRKGREIIGVKEEDVLGVDWVEKYVSKSDRVKTRSIINFIIGGISPMDTLENVIIGKGNKELNIVWHFSILKDSNLKPQSILATGIDVTELTQAKIAINQLKEVDRLKSEVLNIATHELKTPLISIVGLSEVMKKNPKEIPKEYIEYINIINSEGEKLNHLIKGMLTATRNELGKIVVNTEDLSVSNLMTDIKTSLDMLVKRTNSKLEIKNNLNDLVISTDKEKVSQVIYNFVDNAVKYGPNEQTIKILLEEVDSDNIKVSVVGEGKGIEKDLQQKLFKKFSQLEPSLSRSQDGMGLGLYICKQNIDALGGKVGVISEKNKGATFYFILPINKKNKKA